MGVSPVINKIYTMINPNNGARIECTEEFLTQWLSRGFEVESIRVDELG